MDDSNMNGAKENEMSVNFKVETSLNTLIFV